MEKLSRPAWFYLVPLFGLAFWALWRLPGKPMGDFANYYFSARLFWEGNLLPWVYDASQFNDWIESQGFSGIFASFSPFPPVDALLALPFIGLPLPIAKVVFTGISVGLFCIQLWRWFRLEQVPAAVFLLVPILFYRPLVSNIEQGQAYFLVFSLVLEGYFFLKKGQETAAILCWSGAFWLKVFPMVWFAMLLFGLSRKTLWTIALCVGGFLGILILFQGKDIWIFFLTHILPAASDGLIIDRFAPSFQSWNALLSYVFLDENTISIQNRPLMNLLFFGFKSLVTIILLALLAGIGRTEKPGPTTFFAAALSGILITPTGTYYALLPAISVLPFLFGKGQNKSHLQQLIFLTLMALACSISFHNWDQAPLIVRFGRLTLIATIFIIALKPSHLVGQYFLLLGLLFFPYKAVHQWFIYPLDRSVAVEKGIHSAQISDLVGTDAGLQIFFRNGEGRSSQLLPLETERLDTTSVLVRGDAICSGNDTLIWSPDRKKKPILAGQTLYYLSEKNRGPGFFGLRKLNHSLEP